MKFLVLLGCLLAPSVFGTSLGTVEDCFRAKAGIRLLATQNKLREYVSAIQGQEAPQRALEKIDPKIENQDHRITLISFNSQQGFKKLVLREFRIVHNYFGDKIKEAQMTLLVKDDPLAVIPITYDRVYDSRWLKERPQESNLELYIRSGYEGSLSCMEQYKEHAQFLSISNP